MYEFEIDITEPITPERIKKGLKEANSGLMWSFDEGNNVLTQQAEFNRLTRERSGDIVSVGGRDYDQPMDYKSVPEAVDDRERYARHVMLQEPGEEEIWRIYDWVRKEEGLLEVDASNYQINTRVLDRFEQSNAFRQADLQDPDQNYVGDPSIPDSLRDDYREARRRLERVTSQSA